MMHDIQTFSKQKPQICVSAIFNIEYAMTKNKKSAERISTLLCKHVGRKKKLTNADLISKYKEIVIPY